MLYLRVLRARFYATTKSDTSLIRSKASLPRVVSTRRQMPLTARLTPSLPGEAYGVRVGLDVVDEFVFRLDVGGLDAGAHRFGRHVGISRRCWLRRGACGIPWRRRRRERIDLRQHAAVGEIPPHAQFRIVELSPIGLLATGDAWGEWGAEDFMSATGLNYVPQYIAYGFRCLLYVSSHQQ